MSSLSQNQTASADARSSAAAATATPVVPDLQESPFSKTITMSYKAELRPYSEMLTKGDYGPPEDEDSKDDWRADKKDARNRMQMLRGERAKTKLVAGAATAVMGTTTNSGDKHGQDTQKKTKKTQRRSSTGNKHWSQNSGTKSNEPQTIEALQGSFRDAVSQNPTTLWLTPLADEDSAAHGQGDVEDDGHRRVRFFDKIEAKHTANDEDFTVYTEWERDGTMGFTCNCCDKEFSCKVMCSSACYLVRLLHELRRVLIQVYAFVGCRLKDISSTDP